MKCWVMKHIWYLPTWGQECTVIELQQFLFEKFDLGHPVCLETTNIVRYTVKTLLVAALE